MSVLVEILSGDRDHGTFPEGMSVSTQGQHYAQ